MDWFKKSAEEQLWDTRQSLKIISLFLRHQTLPIEQSAFQHFNTPEALAKWIKLMIDHLLPEDMRDKEE